MKFQLDEPPFRFISGSRPLLISFPHVGIGIPKHLEKKLTSVALKREDTDWHLERLYEFAFHLGASLLIATQSRYVIDLNRPPDNQNLYPGQDTTGLCPIDTFGREALYLTEELQPSETEIEARINAVWNPYHERLCQELRRLHEIHGRVALWDAHSIRSQVPRFFEGTLPTWNLGSANGQSCDTQLSMALLEVANGSGYGSAILNGRFKGGFITRHYGQPIDGIQAIQLELAQAAYMEEVFPFTYNEIIATQAQATIRSLLDVVLGYIEQ